MGIPAKRRRALASAVLGRELEPQRASAENGVLLDAVSGTIIDVSPHLIIIENDEGREERLVIAHWAKAWRGAFVAPADLPVGARVIIRALRQGKVVDRIWADVTRMTGIILSVSGRDDISVVLDCGPHRGRRSIVIPYRSSGRVRVRYPQLEPGYLFDAIGTVEGTSVLAQIPATSQPAYRAAHVPSRRRLSGAYRRRSPVRPSGRITSNRVWPTRCWSSRTPAAARRASRAPLSLSRARFERSCTECLRRSRDRASRGGLRLHGGQVLRPMRGMRHLAPRASGGTVGHVIRRTGRRPDQRLLQRPRGIGVSGMIAAAAQPILLVMLVLGGAAKLVTAGRDAEPGALGRLGPAVLAPEAWRKNALIGCAIGEFGLAWGVFLVDHPAPAG